MYHITGNPDIVTNDSLGFFVLRDRANGIEGVFVVIRIVAYQGIDSVLSVDLVPAKGIVGKAFGPGNQIVATGVFIDGKGQFLRGEGGSRFVNKAVKQLCKAGNLTCHGEHQVFLYVDVAIGEGISFQTIQKIPHVTVIAGLPGGGGAHQDNGILGGNFKIIPVVIEPIILVGNAGGTDTAGIHPTELGVGSANEKIADHVEKGVMMTVFVAEGIGLEGNGILCNGSKVYFSAKPSGSQKTIFYRCNVDGTGLKKVKSFTDKADEYMYYRPLAIYNNVLFYEKYGDKGSDSPDSLYSLGLKSGTVKRRVKNFFHDWESGGGRYIYYSKWNEDGSTTLKAYDCKKFKSVTVAKDANAIGTYNSKLYYYKVVYSNGDYSTYNSKIYRCTLSGKEDKSVKTLKDANCTKIKGSKIYYYTGSWGPYDYYYYDLKEKGNPVPITLEEYKAA